jgi:DNA polymerase
MREMFTAGIPPYLELEFACRSTARSRTLFIVSDADIYVANPAIRAWLRNERRLGIPHWPCRADSAHSSTIAAAPHYPAPARPEPTASAPAQINSGPGQLPVLVDRALTSADAQAALTAIDDPFVRGCTQCELHRARNRTVFGVGNPRAEVMFIGEGPGADEDRQGVPFVGEAGQLLTDMIAGMTLTRDQVYITNIVKCRPPGNRTPTPVEADACSPYLWRQIAIVRPRIIVALGRPAAQTLLASSAPIGRLRGRFHDFPPPALAALGLPGSRLMPTFHPAYLLRKPAEKRKAWDDLKQVMRVLGIPVPGDR